jgi:hypothetical protein
MIALEYIVANNAMSAAKPLMVELFAEDNSFIIKYCCQPKAQIESNSEKQLMSLKERYHYLSPYQGMQIVTDGKSGSIHYPLL